MCGIFGLVKSKQFELNDRDIKKNIEHLFILSESRGKESSGIAVKNINSNTINILKEPIPAHFLIKKSEYDDFFSRSITEDSSLAIIGHSRLVTNGSEKDNYNNQPVIKGGMVAVHNGIVVNVNDLWKKYSGDIKKEYEVDTEIFLDILRLNIKNTGSLIRAVQKTFSEIEGAVSIAVIFDDINKVLLATNTGSLYYYLSDNNEFLYFASERYILNKFLKKARIEGGCSEINAGFGKLIDMADINIQDFSIDENDHEKKDSIIFQNEKSIINDLSPEYENNKNINFLKNYSKDILEYNIEAISKLKRCTKCLLPETFPFIIYDEKGVCNYCHNHKMIDYRGEDKLKDIISRYKKKGKHDCIVPFSGGRDSSYGLHYLKKVLGLNPISFTYDWGMVTDLARRNQARMCGKLGIEHILLSADIRKKRSNIRKNVLAWLKNPDLGIIPLFMAGDKQVHYYIHKIKEQNNINLNIWMANQLERTFFKVGFCGIAPEFYKQRTDHLSFLKNLKMSSYYLNQYIKNTSYINSSLYDTIWAYFSQYFSPRKDYYNLFDFIKWNEDEINSVLLNEYNWEMSPDTKSTWRIGDGTTSFYNYIYYTVAGFTENDTFRSNQIREGLLSREGALEMVNKENRGRYESIKWYCDIIGIDLEETIKTINKIPKLYIKN